MTALRDCLVIVNGVSNGSGCFVAPGLVLTCAHVAGDEPGEPVTVRWEGQAYEAVIRAATPKVYVGQVWQPPDLAIVELLQPPARHPAAWLDARFPEPDAKLEIAGHNPAYTDELDKVIATGTAQGEHELAGVPMLRIPGDIVPGMSGGPVLNKATGGVCAVVKATRMPDGDMGGLAAPVRWLRTLDPAVYTRLWREHDRHHAAAAADPGPILISGLRRGEEIKLRALLARRRGHSDHEAGYRRAAGELSRPPRHPLLTSGDVITDLGELCPPPAGTAPAVLTYAADLCGGGGELRDWVFAVAGRLGVLEAIEERLASPGKGVRSVLVCVRPAGHDASRYTMRIWRFVHEHDVTEAELPHEPLGRDDAWEWLRGVLPGQISLLEDGRSRVMVELILPLELMGVGAEQWAIWKKPWSRLGVKHPVVVRDLDRFEEPVTAGWEIRWRRLAEADLATVLDLIDCADARDHEQMESWLEEGTGRAALVLHGPHDEGPARIALETGLFAGVPVMIWRRAACAPASCVAADFYPGLREGLQGLRAAQLPEGIRDLRSRRHHCGQDVVLLWDDPGRRPHLHLMTSA
ncbi:trypsin-like peptidase domain-containing protein [Longispora albida]|uniref:VMAP-C domain-containing protein n=1 Tax=Longispora albida TaxID=203523 RepID=UPI000371046E|nr:trypsin-like peptidase domain-containing protein [Longispora albida]